MITSCASISANMYMTEKKLNLLLFLFHSITNSDYRTILQWSIYLFIQRRLSTQDKITEQQQNDNVTAHSKVPICNGALLSVYSKLDNDGKEKNTLKNKLFDVDCSKRCTQ
jgi:hypothetical protein